MRYSIPLIALSYIGGVLMCARGTWPNSMWWLAGLVVGGICTRHLMPLRTRGYLLPLFLLPLVFGYAITYGQLHTLPANHISRYSSGERWDVSGTIVSLPERWPYQVRLTVKVTEIARSGERRPVRGTIRVTLFGELAALQAGDYVQIKGALLRTPRNYKNPGAFDYETYCKVNGIAATCALHDPSRIALLHRPSGKGLLRTIYHIKERMGDDIQMLLPPLEASILRAMVLGERFSLQPDTEEAFFASGTGHLLAISGLQISFLALFWFLVSRLLLRPLVYRIAKAGQPLLATRLATLITVHAVVAYSLMIGAQISCIRATIMVVTYLIARFFGRERDLYNALALAAIIVLMWKPLALFDIGFQLSFLTVLALVAVNEHTHFFARKERPADRLQARKRFDLLGHLMMYPKISLVASLMVFPLSAYYFHRVPVVGIATNTLVVPLALITTPLGLTASLVSLVFNPLGDFLLFCASAMMTILYACVEWFAGLGLTPLLQGSIPVPRPPLVAIASYYVALGALFLGHRTRAGKVALAGGCAVFALALGLKAASHPDQGLLRVTYLDVGQGDAALLELPGGRRVLIDSGAAYGDRFNMGEAVIIPYLRSQWIGSINMVISSQPQSDHIGGLPPIIREFGVAEYWESASARELNPPFLEEMFIHPATEHVKRFSLRGGVYRALLDGVEFTVLHPTYAFINGVNENGITYAEVNDTSLVVRVRYGQVSFLFPGDISKQAEATLVPLGAALRVTVLKVPHHGSGRSSSTEFLEVVRPAVGVFSVGLNNTYGHPAPDVLRRYREVGSRILRTDRDGAITIETDGRTYSVRTFVAAEGEK